MKLFEFIRSSWALREENAKLRHALELASDVFQNQIKYGVAYVPIDDNDFSGKGYYLGSGILSSIHAALNFKAKRYYGVGDVAPDSLLNRGPGENIGAMVAVDPETHRITAIFTP